MRITRHTAMMQTAEVWSQRSTCFRRNVGAVVASDNRIVSVGYNGAPAGEPHCFGEHCVPPGQVGCIRATHAEINALDHVPLSCFKRPLVMYVTESPCHACAQAILDTFVREVYYLNEYRDPRGIETLITGGVKVFRMTPSGYIIDRSTGRLIGDI